MFPKSSYYINARVYDFVIGLHAIPQNRIWLESKSSNLSIRNGELIPWITYPALNFLEHLDIEGKRVVEFGAGASTVFFTKQKANITSFEFDSEYFDKINPIIGATNLTLVDVSKLKALGEDEIRNHNLIMLIENDKSNTDLDSGFWSNFKIVNVLPLFSQTISEADIVFIDGGLRNFATGVAALSMKPDAILIIDNSDIEYVQFGFASLKEAGFVEIPFYGPGPLNPYEWKTSVFVKTLNALKPEKYQSVSG